MGHVPAPLVVIAALAAVLAPLAFLAGVVVAALARRRGATLAPPVARGLALGGGIALGSMVLIVADDLGIGGWFLLVAALLAVNEWRRGHRAMAGWLVAGTALPWILLWAAALALLARGAAIDAAAAVRGFAIGALPLAAGLVVAGRYADTEAGRAPGAGVPARRFGVIRAALAEANRVGPFPLPELAAAVAWAATGLAVALLPLNDGWVRFVLASVLASALASEAYLRAMSPRARRAMEAFTWLGEQDLRTVRALAQGRLPTTVRGAGRWLTAHAPAGDEADAIRSLRIQALLLIGRTEEAAAIADSGPAATTSLETFEHAADRQLIAWWRDEPDQDATLAGLRAAAGAILPAGSDARLRAEVTVAVAEVRARALVGGLAAPDVLQPLVDARLLLGTRANGLLRRVHGRRLFGLLLAWSVGVELVGVVAGVLPPP